MDTLYFDEAGGTGSNLLDPGQPHFVYAGVQIEGEEAEEVVREIRADHAIQNETEFKGRDLVKRSDGVQIVRRVAKACNGHAFLFVADKRAALAGKLFDYTVEPVLSGAGVRGPFFELGAHTYFLNHFYWIWQLGDDAMREAAGRVAREFQDLARPNKEGAGAALFGGGPSGTDNGFLDAFLAFCVRYETEIRAELTDVASDDALGRWVLELTVSALHVVLERLPSGGPFRVVCDDSLPVKDYLPLLRSAGGAIHGIQVTSYETGASTAHAGIQLADVLASATAFALKDPTPWYATEMMEVLDPFLAWSIAFDPQAVVPGPASQPGMVACEVLFETSARGQTPAQALARAIHILRR